MATLVLNNPVVTVGGVDLHPFATQLQVRQTQKITQITKFGSQGPEQIVSDKSAGDTVTITILQDFDEDAALSIQRMLGTKQPCSVTAAVGDPAPANPSWDGTVTLQDYTALSGNPGESSPNQLTFLVDGKLDLTTAKT